jgi:hypothetical protein
MELHQFIGWIDSFLFATLLNTRYPVPLRYTQIAKQLSLSDEH